MFRKKGQRTQVFYSITLHSLQPWPVGKGNELRVNWIRGNKLQGETASVFPEKSTESTRLAAIYKFQQKFEFKSSILQKPDGSLEKKTIILHIVGNDGNTGDDYRSLGTLVINLCDFAKIGAWRKKFRVSVPKSVRAAVGWPKLDLTIDCHMRQGEVSRHVEDIGLDEEEKESDPDKDESDFENEMGLSRNSSFSGGLDDFDALKQSRSNSRSGSFSRKGSVGGGGGAGLLALNSRRRNSSPGNNSPTARRNSSPHNSPRASPRGSITTPFTVEYDSNSEVDDSPRAPRRRRSSIADVAELKEKILRGTKTLNIVKTNTSPRGGDVVLKVARGCQTESEMYLTGSKLHETKKWMERAEIFESEAGDLKRDLATKVSELRDQTAIEVAVLLPTICSRVSGALKDLQPAVDLTRTSWALKHIQKQKSMSNERRMESENGNGEDTKGQLVNFVQRLHASLEAVIEGSSEDISKLAGWWLNIVAMQWWMPADCDQQKLAALEEDILEKIKNATWYVIALPQLQAENAAVDPGIRWYNILESVDKCIRDDVIDDSGEAADALKLLALHVLAFLARRIDSIVFNYVVLGDDKVNESFGFDSKIDERALPGATKGTSESSFTFNLGIHVKVAVGACMKVFDKLEHSLEAIARIKSRQRGRRGGISMRSPAFQFFPALSSLADLLLLPKDALMDPAMRKEVCPGLGSTTIREVLGRYEANKSADGPASSEVSKLLLSRLNAAIMAETSLEEAQGIEPDVNAVYVKAPNANLNLKASEIMPILSQHDAWKKRLDNSIVPVATTYNDSRYDLLESTWKSVDRPPDIKTRRADGSLFDSDSFNAKHSDTSPRSPLAPKGAERVSKALPILRIRTPVGKPSSDDGDTGLSHDTNDDSISNDDDNDSESDPEFDRALI